MDQTLQGPAGAAPPDWRGLCRELLRELENAIAVHYGEGGTHHISAADAVIANADVALAQPEPEVVGPTDGEPPPGPFSEHDLRQQWNQQADEFNQWDSLDSSEQLAWAQVRAIAADRARWGRPAPLPAAPGEVGDYADFVAWLVNEMPAGTVISDPLWWAPRIARRAASLLERQAAPVPVAVSERLPGAEDCDAEGRCWWFLPSRQFKFLDQCARWSLMAHSPSQDNRRRRTHWLPFNALPLPNGEVE